MPLAAKTQDEFFAPGGLVFNADCQFHIIVIYNYLYINHLSLSRWGKTPTSHTLNT